MLMDTKKNNVVVGIDIGEQYSQISYCRADQSMPETISLVMGEEQYNIPIVLEKGQEEESIRKLIGFLGGYTGGEEIAALAFTVNNLTTELMEKIKACTDTVLKKPANVYFLSHEDCFFQYIIHQPDEIWIHDVLLYDYKDDGIKSFLMTMNRKTSPVASFIDSSIFPHMRLENVADKPAREKDEMFLEILKRNCEDRTVTSVFLLGEHFSKEWCRESLKYMCKGRRVFQGNNLFSKGACYGAREKIFPSVLGSSFIYLSDDKLRANIGMVCDKGQAEMYYPILSAGTSWYEADKRFDIMLVKGNAITLNIVPIDGNTSRTARISLEGLKVRGNKTNRIGLHFYMEKPDAVCIEITDLGFGEIFPSTGQVWKECIPVE